MQPHDRLFRSSMSDLQVAKDFFKHYIFKFRRNYDYQDTSCVLQYVWTYL